MFYCFGVIGIFCCMFVSRCQFVWGLPYELISLNGSNVYFRKDASVRFYEDEWTVLTGIVVPDFEIELEKAKVYKRDMNDLCEVLKKSGTGRVCDQILRETTALIIDLEEMNEELNQFLGTSKYKTKRSFFDGIGSVAKTLFGTMDSEDSKLIDQRLQGLEDKEKDTMNLLKHQVTVVKSLFDSMNETFLGGMGFESKLNAFNDKLSKNDNSLGEFKVEMGLLEMSSVVNLDLLRITKMQESFMSALTFLKLGKLHPKVLGREQLIETYRQAGESLGIKNIEINFNVIMQIIRVETVFDKREVLVKIILPILQHRDYDLYEIVLIPQPVHNDLVRIVNVGDKYVAANIRIKSYALMNEEDYATCQKIMTVKDEKDIVCKLKVPIFSGSGGKCSLQLFLHESANCNFKIGTSSDLFMKVDLNEWMYVFQGEKHMRVVCDEGTYEIDVNGSGMIRLTAGCEIHYKELIMRSRGSVIKKLPIRKSAFGSWGLNFSADILKGMETIIKKNSSDVPKIVSLKHHNKLLQDGALEIQNLLNEIDGTEKKYQNKKILVGHSVVTGVIWVIMLILVICIIIAVKRLRNKIKTMHKGRRNISMAKGVEMERVGRLESRPIVSRPICKSLPSIPDGGYERPIELKQVSIEMQVKKHPEYNLIG